MIFDFEKPELTNLISLSKKRIEYGHCKHRKMIINEGESELTCKDCKEKLDPMWALSRMAKEEKTIYRYLHQQYTRLKNIEIAVRRKIRTKCKHCGRFTPVNINMTDSEWMGWNKIKDKK